ncbi:MAG: hypothetical protein HUK22_07420 [Thermoguttaceae bacterium]|nr:hypothetical protein [Thermoguttaceae bacterium]
MVSTTAAEENGDDGSVENEEIPSLPPAAPEIPEEIELPSASRGTLNTLDADEVVFYSSESNSDSKTTIVQNGAKWTAPANAKPTGVKSVSATTPATSNATKTVETVEFVAPAPAAAPVAASNAVSSASSQKKRVAAPPKLRTKYNTGPPNMRAGSLF